MIFRSNTPKLHIEGLKHEDPNPYGNTPSVFYKATANVRLWGDTIGEKILFPMVTLERVLTTAGVSIDYDQRRAINEPNEIWIMRHTTNPEESPLTADSLNDVISGQGPNVRITRSNEFPGVLMAHRDVLIGRYALFAVAGLPEIQNVKRIPTNERAPGLYPLYPDGALVAALAAPDASMDQAERAVRNILTM